MLCFFSVLFVISFGVNALPRDESNIFNSRQSTFNGQQQQTISLGSPPNIGINDADYWDNDDFVPYKNDRHDAFDWRLLKNVLLKSSNNVIVSPFSVKLVLALLAEAAGAESLTQNELAAILPNLRSPVLIRELYKSVLGSLKMKSAYYDLNVGTKMYVDKFVEPRQRYASIINSHYDTEVEQLDFHDGNRAAQIINNWCANITAGHLKNLVTRGDIQNSVMLILNAIYFDGLWSRPFFENNTVELPFFTSPSKNARASFMSQTDDFYFYESTEWDAKIIRLPYKGKKFSMTIMLPNAKASLEKLIREVDGAGLNRLQWLMDESQVKVTLPKFKFEYTSHLKEVLQSLGINEIFTPSASLPGLARGSALNNQLQVSDIIQKAGLIVHEQGSTAFAATEVTLINKFGGSILREFNANRPFIFLIEDETTGTLLFAGKVVDPSQ